MCIVIDFKKVSLEKKFVNLINKNEEITFNGWDVMDKNTFLINLKNKEIEVVEQVNEKRSCT